MKQTVLNYFEQLNYAVLSQTEVCCLLRQKRTGLEVELDFSVLGESKLPLNVVQQAHKKLIFMNINDVESIGFDVLENYTNHLKEHCSIAVLEGDYFEHTMKEIWMFLSNDPRDRDVFNESRFYKNN